MVVMGALRGSVKWVYLGWVPPLQQFAPSLSSEENASLFFPPGGKRVGACAAHFSSWLSLELNV